MTLQKFTLSKNKQSGDWDLTNDKTNKVVESFETKTEATKGGVLSSAIGDNGGSVKIKLENGRFQEERTYPPSADPRDSRG